MPWGQTINQLIVAISLQKEKTTFLCNISFMFACNSSFHVQHVQKEGAKVSVLTFSG